MTDTNTGTPDTTSTPGQPGEGGGRNGAKAGIVIAAIGALAVVAAATIPAMLNRHTTVDPTGTESPTFSAPNSVQDDPCDLDRLGDYWVQPPSQRYNETLFASHQRPRVFSQVSPDSNPEVSVKGRLGIDVPAGQVLYLIRRPDPKTKDTFGNPGNNRFYPATSITPTSAGCWEDDNRPVGYPGVKGIGQIYLLVLVSRDQAAKFPADRKAKDWDGYSQDQWRAINSIDVMSFNVSTA
ncbi:hypothetical protein [Streptomyces sp. MBT33]|uniref:hypothetical protein n=1 Tax=unclassified Streptomyces TaxID=2593676 RepID=UPI00190BC569|nr:hypothetical protein [Streptomyces sp. MBT33]MBK3641425.1 hypothetical protein [Streptomyces sp. MBT33]